MDNAENRAETQEIKYMNIRFQNKKIKETFVIGGDWTMVDKTGKASLMKLAKNENRDRFDNKYLGAAVQNTPDINEYRAYGMFLEIPRNARSLALAHAMHYMGQGTVTSGETQKPIVRFFHLRDESGKEVVWITTIVDDIVQDDRIVDQMQSFDVENDVRSEYNNEIDFRRYEVGESLDYLEDIWTSLTPKQQKQCRIISFTGYARRVLVIMLVLGLLGSGVFGGVTWWGVKQKEKMDVERMLQQEAQASRQINALKKSAFPPVWIDEPLPTLVMETIENRLRVIPLTKNGWSFSAVRFSAKGGTISESTQYTRGQGEPYMDPPGKTNAKKPFQSVVSSSEKLQYKKRQAGIMKLKNAEKWLLQLSIGQPYKLTFTLGQRPSKTVNVGSTPVTIVAAYQIIDVNIKDLETLSGIERLLNAPGLVIESVSYMRYKWQITGKLYVLP